MGNGVYVISGTGLTLSDPSRAHLIDFLRWVFANFYLFYLIFFWLCFLFDLMGTGFFVF